jgi:CBS domain-containing protein
MLAPISTVMKGQARPIASVSPDATVLEAVLEMNKCGVGCVLVMDGETLAGIFTERDVLTRVIVKSTPTNTLRVRDVMTPNPTTTTLDATVQEVMELLNAKHMRHLPVVVDGRVHGVLSMRDISAWLAEAHRAEAAQLRDYISGYPSL